MGHFFSIANLLYNRECDILQRGGVVLAFILQKGGVVLANYIYNRKKEEVKLLICKFKLPIKVKNRKYDLLMVVLLRNLLYY